MLSMISSGEGCSKASRGSNEPRGAFFRISTGLAYFIDLVLPLVTEVNSKSALLAAIGPFFIPAA